MWVSPKSNGQCPYKGKKRYMKTQGRPREAGHVQEAEKKLRCRKPEAAKDSQEPAESREAIKADLALEPLKKHSPADTLILNRSSPEL